MSRYRRRTERKPGDTSNKRRGGNRWCRLHVECLERRLLLSGNSLLGALESAPTALLSTLESVTALQQPTAAPTNNQSNNPADEPGSLAQTDWSDKTESSQHDGSLTGSGLSLDLAGLASVQVGESTKAAGGAANEHAGSPGLLNLSLGNGTNAGSQTKDSLTSAELNALLGAKSTSEGEASSSPAIGGMQIGSLLMSFEIEVGNAGLIPSESPPGGPQVDSVRDATVEFHTVTYANSFTLSNMDQFAQMLGQTVAKEARQANDPHAIDPTIAAVTARGSEMEAATFQAPMPTPVVSASQIPANPTSAATSVTDAAELQLSLVGRAAAAVMPVAWRLATDTMIAKSANTDPEAATNAPADDAEAPSESAVTAIQAASSLVPTGLLAIAPGDLRAVDQALERLLDEIDALGGGLVDYAASSDMLQWATAGAGLAACVGGAYFHRKRRSGTGPSLEEESASWMFSRMQSLAASGD